jgi:Cu+-exporting ATPase
MVTMAKDPVCGMQADPTKAADTSEYQNNTYVSCSAGCTRKFDNNPQQ